MYDVHNFPHTRTYDDDLGWLIHVVKKLDGDYQGLLSRIAAMEDAFNSIDPKIQAAIAEMKAQVNAEIAAMKQTLNNAIAEINKDVSEKLADIDARVNALIAEVKEEVKKAIALIYKMEQMVLDYYEASKAYTDKETEKVKEELLKYLDEKLIEYSGKMVSLSPVYRRVMPTDVVLDDMYRILGWGVEARWLDAMGITAGELDKIGVRAGEFDTKAWYYLKKWWEKKHKIHAIANPFTGGLDKHRDVIASMTDYMQKQVGIVQVADLDAAGITAAELDALQIPAYQMDWIAGWFTEWKQQKEEENEGDNGEAEETG